MPSMADIIVKKSDGTTNITYTALNPSAGDSVPAVWRSETAGTAPGFKPLLKLWAKNNGPRTARRVEYTYSYPQTMTDTTTNVTSVVNVPVGGGYFVIPNEVPDATLAEFVDQQLNLLGSTLVRASVKAGFAPT
nr:MAG: coat protein [Leviviridae sp.]